MLRQRAREVAGQSLIDVLAVVVTLEHGLEQVGDVTAATQVEARIGRFVFLWAWGYLVGSYNSRFIGRKWLWLLSLLLRLDIPRAES
jgi:hypothetical protein